MQHQRSSDGGVEADGATEKEIAEAYISSKDLEDTLNDALSFVVATRPEDPYIVLSSILAERSTLRTGIFFVEVKRIFDGACMPGVLVRLHTSKGIFEGSVSSGRHTSSNQENLHDGNTEDGLSDAKLQTAQSLLTKLLSDVNPADQSQIDSLLTEEETNIGKPICLGVSIAVCRAGANYSHTRLSRYIADIGEVSSQDMVMPIPIMSLINGGAFASNKLYLKDVFIAPVELETFDDSISIGKSVMEEVEERLRQRGTGYTNIGELGGLTPQLESPSEAIQYVQDAIQALEERLGNNSAFLTSKRYLVGVDVSGEDFVILSEHKPASSDTGNSKDEAGKVLPCSYNIDKWSTNLSGSLQSSEDLADSLMALVRQLDLVFIIDPFACKDIASFAKLHASTKTLSSTKVSLQEKSKAGVNANQIHVVADRLATVFPLEVLQKKKACNAIAVCLEQFSTVTKAIETIAEAHRLQLDVILTTKRNDCITADFLAVFTLGCRVRYVRFGGLNSAAAIQRYNEMCLQLQEENSFQEQ